MHFSTLANTVALAAVAALLIAWLTIGRRQLVGFLLMAGGDLAIVWMLRSDQATGTLLGILLASSLFTAILVALQAAIKSHRAAHARRLRYIPMDQRRQGREEKKTPATRPNRNFHVGPHFESIYDD